LVRPISCSALGSSIGRPFSPSSTISAFCSGSDFRVSFLGVDLGGPQGPYLAWAPGFLSGFSERFAQDFVIGASANLGELNPLDPSPSTGGRQDCE
jgi:hypothetical protein